MARQKKETGAAERSTKRVMTNETGAAERHTKKGAAAGTDVDENQIKKGAKTRTAERSTKRAMVTKADHGEDRRIGDKETTEKRLTTKNEDAAKSKSKSSVADFPLRSGTITKTSKVEENDNAVLIRDWRSKPRNCSIEDDISDEEKPIRKALTPEGRENQLIAYAYDLVEQRLLNGTATSQETTHFLKMGSTKAKLEKQILETQAELYRAKAEAYESAKKTEELYAKAIAAMRRYSGQGEDAEDEEDIF